MISWVLALRARRLVGVGREGFADGFERDGVEGRRVGTNIGPEGA